MAKIYLALAMDSQELADSHLAKQHSWVVNGFCVTGATGQVRAEQLVREGLAQYLEKKFRWTVVIL